jgi:predicted nucleotidyltransferase
LSTENRSVIDPAIPTLKELRARRDDVIRILVHKGALNARVFGSVVRGTSDSRSDIDILIDLAEPRPRGFDYFGVLAELEEELSALLGCPVHVTEIVDPSGPEAVRILREAVPV